MYFFVASVHTLSLTAQTHSLEVKLFIQEVICFLSRQIEVKRNHNRNFAKTSLRSGLTFFFFFFFFPLPFCGTPLKSSLIVFKHFRQIKSAQPRLMTIDNYCLQ